MRPEVQRPHPDPLDAPPPGAGRGPGTWLIRSLWLSLPLAALAIPAVRAGLPSAAAAILHPSTWYITRAAGIMAYLFLWLAAVTGLLLSTRAPGPALPPPVLGAAHQWASAWSLYAAVVHAVILLYDHWVAFRWADLLLPFASAYRTVPVALGVYALYGMAGVQVTSYLRARLGPGAWRRVHALSVPAFGLALAHGVATGTDTPAPWMQALYWSTGSLFAFLFAARILAACLRATGARRSAD